MDIPYTGKGLISFAFASSEMMDQNLETTLLKVIRASDENEISQGWQMDLPTKQNLKNLVSELKGKKRVDIKPGRNPTSLRSKGFGKSI